MFTIISLIIFTFHLQMFKKFNALNSLTIRDNILEKDLIEVISKKETITVLELSDCKIKGLNLLTNLSNLEYLDLEKVQEVDDNFLACLVKKCKKLENLDLSGCKKLSDDGIGELKNLDNLEELYINNMADIVSDLPLSQLKKIKILKCQNCAGVRDPGIMQLLENCQNLGKLDLLGTSISRETLQFAISVTKNRKNSIVLDLSAETGRLNFNPEKEDYSPFLKITEISSDSEDDFSDSSSSDSCGNFFEYLSPLWYEYFNNYLLESEDEY